MNGVGLRTAAPYSPALHRLCLLAVCGVVVRPTPKFGPEALALTEQRMRDEYADVVDQGVSQILRRHTARIMCSDSGSGWGVEVVRLACCRAVRWRWPRAV